jgi:hypothetical protein
MLLEFMVPESRQLQQTATDANQSDADGQFVSGETLVLRNYDSEQEHDVTVRFLNADSGNAFQQTYTLAPGAVMSISFRLQRAVYRVEVSVDDGGTANAKCLIGSGPDETALIKVGNGLVSVAEGVY